MQLAKSVVLAASADGSARDWRSNAFIPPGSLSKKEHRPAQYRGARPKESNADWSLSQDDWKGFGPKSSWLRDQSEHTWG